MEETRMFHISDILSITSDYLVSIRHMEGIYDILTYMVGEDLKTNQLSRVADECTPYLLMEMPWLKEIDASGINEENLEARMKEIASRWGEYHEVRPIHYEDHEVIDSLDEAEMIAGEENVYIVDLGGDSSTYGDIGWNDNRDE